MSLHFRLKLSESSFAKLDYLFIQNGVSQSREIDLPTQNSTDQTCPKTSDFGQREPPDFDLLE
jgi:hypothetical protein